MEEITEKMMFEILKNEEWCKGLSSTGAGFQEKVVKVAFNFTDAFMREARK